MANYQGAFTGAEIDNLLGEVNSGILAELVDSGAKNVIQVDELGLSGTHGTTSASYDVQDNGNGVVLTSYTGASNIIIRIRISPDYSPNGLVIKPMICTKAAWAISQTYQPYRPSYQELYERVVALENQ